MAFSPAAFFREAYQELRKSTWLDREQLTGSTVVVLLLMAMVAVYSSALDFVLSIAVGTLLGGGAP